jgi:magnesium-transporting ATPase (P-type)
MGRRIVNAFRWNNDHGSAPVLLAIGDGANDVAMLQVCI